MSGNITAVSKRGFVELPSQVITLAASFLTVQEYFITKRVAHCFDTVKFHGNISVSKVDQVMKVFSYPPERQALQHVKVLKLSFPQITGLKWSRINFQARQNILTDLKSGLAKVEMQCPFLTHLGLTTGISDTSFFISKLPRLTRLDLADCEWEKVVEQIKTWPQLKELHIRTKFPKIEPNLLPAYAKISQLKSIELHEVDPSGVKAFWNHPCLESLVLSNGVGGLPNNECAKNLVKIPHLKNLELVKCTNITDLSFLEEMPNLRRFKLDSFFRATMSELFATLKPSKNLEELIVDSCFGWGDESIPYIARCTMLKRLALCGDSAGFKLRFTDQGLKLLSACSLLEYLELGNSDNKSWMITTQGVVDLALKLPRLRELNLSGCKFPTVDPNAVAEALLKALPNLRVIKAKG